MTEDEFRARVLSTLERIADSVEGSLINLTDVQGDLRSMRSDLQDMRDYLRDVADAVAPQSK
jgi:hypothetical protein